MKNKKSIITKVSLITAVLIIFVLVHSVLNFNPTGAQEKQNSETAKIDQAQPKFALLVGITKYKNEKLLNQIDGCENNVSLLSETLVKDYGFSEKEILPLVNEKASKDAIISSFRSYLIENAKKAKEQGKEAVIIYYFCGHGSQYPDQDKDENDGLDETFVAFDSRTADVFDILDDEIDDLKTELRPHTTNTTLVLESCHSGTGSRGDSRDEQYITEEADKDERPRPPYQRKYPPTKDEDALTYTEIAASLSTNTAKSESAKFCNCEKPMSLMTKALIQGLKRANHNTTYRGLVREVSSEVSTQSRQEPQVEGNRDAVLFGGKAKRANPYIEIEKIMPNNQIIIKAGTIHGLKVGSQVSIYSSQSLTNTGKEGWLTNGIVNQVGNVASVVNISSAADDPKVKEIKISSHIVLASPVFGGGSVLLVLNSDNARSPNNQEADLRQKIEARLKDEGLLENQILKLVPTDKISAPEKKESKGIIRLRKGIVKDIFTQPITNKVYPMIPLVEETICDGSNLVINGKEKRFPAQNAEVYYLDEGEAGGAPLFGKTFDPSDKQLVEKITESIRDFAYQNNLRSLDNTASNLSSQIRVSVLSIPGDAIIERCEDGKKKHSPNNEKFKGFQEVKNNKIPVNSYFQLKIKNISGEENRRIKKDEFASGEPFHISVIALTTDGKIKNQYASKGANDALIDGGEINVVLRMTEPVGIERFIIIVSKANVDFSFYESRGAKRNPKSLLEQVLTQSGTRSRDSGTVVKDEPDQWDVIHLDLNIIEE